MSDNEINVTHDDLISKILTFNSEDGERASDAGKTRNAIGSFLEETSINSKVFAWARQILKQKKETDQLDIIRSLETVLPMIANHVRGQNTDEMDFDTESPEDDDDLNLDDIEVEEGQTDDPDVNEFNEAVDAAVEDDNVVPMGAA